MFLFFFLLQNINKTWNTNDPDFTPCFQRTVLIWVPCGFLWLFAALEVFYIRNNINRNTPWGFVNVAKLILTAGLIVLSLIDLIVVIANQEDQDVFPIDFYTPVIKIATFVSRLKLLFRIFCISLNYCNIFYLFVLLILSGIICGSSTFQPKGWS